jgi:nicotinamidase/pyrazinamidase
MGVKTKPPAHGPTDMKPIVLTRADGLIIVDVQNDFLPGGALPIRRGDDVIGPTNRLIALYREQGLPVYASRDWHPPDHCSFKAQGGPWPPHCVAHTHGAAFPEALHLPADAAIISKAATRGSDAYSAFRETTLADQLHALGIERIAVCGLATDYCVLNTVTDALALGFRVIVVLDATRAVNAAPGDGERAIRQMAERGAVLVKSAPASLLEEACMIEISHNEGAGGLVHPVQ